MSVNALDNMLTSTNDGVECTNIQEEGGGARFQCANFEGGGASFQCADFEGGSISVHGYLKIPLPPGTN